MAKGLYSGLVNNIQGGVMPKVAIVTDSTASIPQSLLSQYEITAIPLTVIWGEETLQDGVDISPDEFYKRLVGSKVMPTTSQVSILAMQETFSALLEKGFDVLGIFISSKLSGTFDSALQARQALAHGAEKVSLVDSLATIMAMGWPVLTAARAAEAGESLAECTRIAEQACDQTGVLFVVETLEYLRRGGRIGGAQALLGTALNIKPLLELQKGRIESVEKIRTKGKALERMLDMAGEKIGSRTPVRLAAAHANCEAEAQNILSRAVDRFKPVETIISPLSPAIGTHAGPGTVALIYMTGF
jgi:DegV family protein with EDD domain